VLWLMEVCKVGSVLEISTLPLESGIYKGFTVKGRRRNCESENPIYRKLGLIATNPRISIL
jgi:hypothetical protein